MKDQETCYSQPPRRGELQLGAEKLDDGTYRIRWYYRLLWDRKNVAYHDYIKTVLSKDEIESIFPPGASVEYIGDMFEFWLGMLELGIIQFLTMFGNWGASSDNCLAGLEESFYYSQTHADMETP